MHVSQELSDLLTIRTSMTNMPRQHYVIELWIFRRESEWGLMSVGNKTANVRCIGSQPKAFAISVAFVVDN